ncbi:MAG: hypothetical protein NT079_06785, partial [Candidatus Omnitrophica bacterium]|nr:hypothetical protein [Candidatus Omnitrophota bacterium]
TSLLSVFTDKPVYRGWHTRKKEENILFYDSEYVGDDPDERFIFGDESVIVNGEEVFLCDISEKNMLRQFKTRFVSLKHVYRFEDAAQRRILLDMVKECLGGSAGMLLQYIEYLTNLKYGLLERRLVLIPQAGKLEDVLDIFERINTRNTKLNIFDVMVAKTYKKVIEGEREGYFDFRSYLKIISASGNINDSYFKNCDALDMDKISVVIDEATLIFLIMVILKKQFKQKEILKITTEDLVTNVKIIHKVYQEILNELKSSFKIDAQEVDKFKPIMKFLTAYFSSSESLSVPEEKQFLQKWFWNTVIYNRYPGSQNEKVEKDFKNLKGLNWSASKKTIINERTRRFLSTENFDAYYTNQNNQLYIALTAVFMNNNPCDLYS